MIKKILPLFLVIPLFFTLSSVWAKPNLNNLSLTTPGTQRILKLPEQADNSPVIKLGTTIDQKSGKIVEGLAIIHYKEKAKPLKPGASKSAQCYSYLANGAKWRSVETWLVNPTNSRALDNNYVFSNLSNDISKWEDAADGVVNQIEGYDILGTGSISYADLSADTVSPDGQNEVSFANVSTQNAIAVTIIWGVFGGPPQTRELVEWDMVFDDVDYDWSANGEANKMDFENIATHELGHSSGMGDLYNTCKEETMFGYAENGEIVKRDLNQGDIQGISKLY